MKRIIAMLSIAILFALATIACGTPTSKCSPDCATGEVCFAEDGKTYSCKKSCTKNEDCTAPLVCHSDETPAHCGEAE